MFKLARFAVKYPTTVAMMVLAVFLLGYISYQRLGMDLLPRIHSPRLFIDVQAGERPPEEMEKQFVERIESLASRGRNVTNVLSLSRVGKALITVEYQWNTDMQEAYLDLQKAVADFGQSSAADSIAVTQLDPNAQPVVTAVLVHDEITDLDKLRLTAENNIRNELIRLPGVAAVELLGDRRREVEVKTDAYSLESFGLTMDQLGATIQNFNRNLAGGSITEMGIRYTVRGVGQLTSLDDIKNLIVAYKAKAATSQQPAERTPIYLRDVADVRFVLSEPENVVRYNGRPAIALEIYKEAGANTTAASKSIGNELEALRRSLPGYQIPIIQDQASFIKAAIGEVEEAGIIGGILALLVLYVFLRKAGVTAIIGLAIPISVVATFNLMYFNNLTLNIMTLGGLALGIGMLVDNAIVVGENIFRHVEAGASIQDAAVQGAGEVGGAITSATLTTIVVFFPIVYLHGVAGELFKDQAWTVAFSLLSSILVAMAVIPMLFSRVIKPRTVAVASKAIRFEFYGRILQGILRKRWLVVLITLGIVGGAVFCLRFMGSEFMPQEAQKELDIHLRLPEGTGLERTEGAVRNIEALIEQRAGDLIDRIFARVGPKGTAETTSEALEDENNAVLQVGFKKESLSSLPGVIAGLEKELSAIPDLDVQFIKQQTTLQAALGTQDAPLVVEIKGQDLETLIDLSDGVKAKLANLPELANVETNFQAGRPQVDIQVDKAQAARFSLRADTIGSQVKNVLAGSDLGELEDQGEYVKIMLRNPKVSVGDLQDIVLTTPSGLRIPLSEVARLVRTESPREIIRNNQTRVAEVRAQLAGRTSFDKVVSRVGEAIKDTVLPEGYVMSIAGEELLRRESFQSLKFALILAIILIYMVLAAQFESLVHPLIVLFIMPLAGVGAILLMFVTGVPFSSISIIGLIILVGIADNDSVILIDLINRSRRAGMGLDEAIIFAGRHRIRPILMMSLTTILALVPLILGLGEGASLRAPLAVAVIGGMISSTLLTLVVIPAMYRLVEGRRAARKNGA
ncbi:MAG: efflux RND transporter permease subunit [Candidatus Aminicenantes bacterium]|nr:efflux RND transporter permease subunit [Candidatus Aminicenantes bacterium]